jgi:hypothetical protein
MTKTVSIALIASGRSFDKNNDRCSSLNKEDAVEDEGDKTVPEVTFAVEEVDDVRRCEVGLVNDIASLAPVRTGEGATSSAQYDIATKSEATIRGSMIVFEVITTCSQIESDKRAIETPRAGDADRPDAEVDSTSESAATISATVGTAFTCDNFVAFDVTVGINRDALTAADTVDADDCAVNAQVEVGFRRASKTPVRSRLGEWIDIAIDRMRVFVW